MGCVNVTPEGEKEARDRSNLIDKQLRQSAKEYENTIKILLLGECLELASKQLSLHNSAPALLY